MARRTQDRDQPAEGFNPRRFITGGNATFTLVGRETRYTFKINASTPTEKYPLISYFVALLTGPDNTADYTYVGMLDVTAGIVKLTAKSTYRSDSLPVVALNWALGRLWAGKDLPLPAALVHCGRCGRCGRLLTVPSSVISGFGPECSARMGA